MRNLVCHRCCPDHPINAGGIQTNWHTHGGLVFLLSQMKPFSEQDFRKWVADEKGMINAFCCCLELYCELRKKNDLNEEISLWMDYKHPSEKELKFERIFFNCLFSFFNQDCQQVHPIQLPKENIRDIAVFLQVLRPCLHRVLCDYDDVWASHVSEHNFENHLLGWLPKKFSKHRNFYPEVYWIPHDKNVIEKIHMKKILDMSNYFSVEVAPLDSACLMHSFKGFRQITPSIDGQPSSCIGLISRRRLRSNGAIITSAPESTMGRDHPFVKLIDPIPLSEWFFYFDDVTQLACIQEYCCSISLQNLLEFIDLFKNMKSKILALSVL